MIYLRARHYAPGTGRFLTKDTWSGASTSPISYNKWAYANDNPLYYTDPSGNFPFPLFLLLLGLGLITFGTSGCSIDIGPEPDVCSPLPANLEPDELSSIPREQALERIRVGLGIQLPPSVTYTDISGNSHSTSYHFVYSSLRDDLGYTPWFSGNNPFIEGEWGDVIIYEMNFKVFGSNAYDIASTMVHEAMHAWQQYTLVQLSQDNGSSFAQKYENKTYYTKPWQLTYTPAMEYQASSYVIQHSPKPLCTRKTAGNNQTRYQEKYKEGAENTPVPEIGQSWPLVGYPLP